MYDLIIIGGGAAGFFSAIQVAERKQDARILILEKSKKTLSKVRISGGGRCNVTHACFDPREMVTHYPRGMKELLGPFNRFLCGDMMAWLGENGVETKIEADGRVFPTSDSSETIIDCFKKKCSQYGIEIKTQMGMDFYSPHNGHWVVNDNLSTKYLLIASGSTPSLWRLLGEVGYNIISAVPSLFTFNIKHPIIDNLSGLSVENGKLSINGTSFSASGPILITHWGLSGPAVLKLSAFAARELSAKSYQFSIEVDWGGEGRRAIEKQLDQKRQDAGQSLLRTNKLLNLPKRLWTNICRHSGLMEKNYASLTSDEMSMLIDAITSCKFEVNGKSTFKEEFVTAGGVDKKQIDFRTMESRLQEGVFFAGEVIDIDAITGGFNFQAAWTEAFIAAEAIANRL